MAIGADTLQALAVSNGAPSGWFSGAVRLAFEGREDIFLTWKNAASGDCFLSASRAVEWKPFALAEFPVWTGSWSELIGCELESANFYAAQGGSLAAVRHQFMKQSAPNELWICVGNEQFNEVGEGNDIFVSQRPPTGLTALTQIAVNAS